MAELEGLTHSGICATDLVESEDFYVRLLGAKFANRSGFHIDKAARGRSLNTVVVLSNYLLALMVPKEEIPVPHKDQQAGDDPFRHGFAVSKQRFSDIVERLQDMGIPHEGPVTHPENGPLGQSVYFQDPAGNFMEICWRRDEAYPYNPTLPRKARGEGVIFPPPRRGRAREGVTSPKRRRAGAVREEIHGTGRRRAVAAHDHHLRHDKRGRARGRGSHCRPRLL